jgi:hypothetical protein
MMDTRRASRLTMIDWWNAASPGSAAAAAWRRASAKPNGRARTSNVPAWVQAMRMSAGAVAMRATEREQMMQAQSSAEQ